MYISGVLTEIKRMVQAIQDNAYSLKAKVRKYVFEHCNWTPVGLHEFYPAGTWRKYNVASTSMQRHDVASTLRAHDVNITSLQRRCNVMTLQRRFNVDATSWRCIDVEGTWRKYNVASTSMQRHDVASTLWRRYIYVMCLPGTISDLTKVKYSFLTIFIIIQIISLTSQKYMYQREGHPKR